MSEQHTSTVEGVRDVGDTGPTEHGDDERSWFYDHVGRLAGIVIGALVVALVAFLAIAGYEPAITLLVIFVAGVLVIAVGGKMRGVR